MSQEGAAAEPEMLPEVPSETPPEVVSDAGPTGWLPAERSERITNFVLACVAAIVLGVAVYLSPSPAGHGTHQQLGLPACNFMVATGYPCLSCGMTTSFSHAVRGELISSFLAQPFGMFLAVCTIVSVPLLLWSCLRFWLLFWCWRLFRNSFFKALAADAGAVG